MTAHNRAAHILIVTNFLSPVDLRLLQQGLRPGGLKARYRVVVDQRSRLDRCRACSADFVLVWD
jgi:hypothetical protein